MRVAHVTPVFPPYRGGMGNVAFHQARSLANRGVEVTVFTPRAASPPESPPGVRVEALRPLVAAGNAACLPQVLWRLAGHDVVHLHYPFFGTAELVALRRRLGGPPLVLQYQMDVVGRGLAAHVFRWHRRLLLPLVARAADAIVVTSRDYAADSFLRRWPDLVRERTFEIPPGVDLERFRPRPASDPGNRPDREHRLFFLGGLDRAHYFKGLHTLIDALRRVPDTVLVVGGDGDLRPEYEARVAALGLGSRVRFLGNVAEEDLPARYREADVVVLPSVDRTEAFGIVLLEAMASGKPVVASRLAGVRTLVEDGRNGYLAQPDNPSDLADKIAAALREASRLGSEGRRMAESRYDWGNLAKELLAVYERIAQKVA